MKFHRVLLGLVALSRITAAVDTAKSALTSAPMEKDGLQVRVRGDKTLFARSAPESGPGRPATQAIDPQKAPFWIGKATSKDLAMELNEAPPEPTTRPTAPASKDGLAAFDIKQRKDKDAIKILTEGGKTILSITSPGGISGVTIERKGDQWPDALVLRLHLRGLESLRIVSGDTTLRASVSSRDGNPRLLQLEKVKTEARQLAKEDPYWTEIQTFDGMGKPVNGLPPEGGWFEMAIPKALLAGQNKTLTLDWIDFYR